MEKPFYIIEKTPFDFPVVFSTSYDRLFNHLIDIESALNTFGYRGTVLFDLFGCNGNSRNRFFLGEFDGQKFVRSSLAVTCDLRFITWCNSFLCSTPSILTAPVSPLNNIVAINSGFVASKDAEKNLKKGSHLLNSFARNK